LSPCSQIGILSVLIFPHYLLSAEKKKRSIAMSYGQISIKERYVIELREKQFLLNLSILGSVDKMRMPMAYYDNISLSL